MKLLYEAFPDADGFLISKSCDRGFLTGFFSEDALLLCSQKPFLITDSRYAVAVKEARVPARIAGDYLGEAMRLCSEQGLHRLGIQAQALSAADYCTLRQKGFELFDMGGVLTQKRSVKQSGEIENICRAQAITDRAYRRLLGFMHPGMTEKQVRAQLDFFLFDEGADGLAFDTIVASGENGAKPHAVPGERILQKGDFVTMDFGAVYRGYCSDMTRTVAIGDVSEPMLRAYEAVSLAQDEAMRAARPGVTGAFVDEAARRVLRDRGLEQYFTHSLGHGVGLEIHEEPCFSKRNDVPLTENQVVTVEPGIYIEGAFGLRIENMIVLTRDGNKNLTGSDKKLIKIT